MTSRNLSRDFGKFGTGITDLWQDGGCAVGCVIQECSRSPITDERATHDVPEAESGGSWGD